ncbi:MAG TPA: DsbA family protein [Actinomycetes bacterium]|nr:DsbA family protein [Actinomycetes bacterium]
MLTVFSDLHCPWAYVFSIRLRRARAGVGQPPVAWRCWPLELVNERGTPWDSLSQEIPVLTQLEPDHFAPPRRETWPSTLLPAMEALKVAGELGGPQAADRFDEVARRAFFLDRRDLSIRPTLLDLAAGAGLDREAFQVAFDGGGHRRGVIADWQEGRRRGVEGSPHAFLPDGSAVFNPGIGKIDWFHGIPVPREVDEGAIASLLDRATSG